MWKGPKLGLQPHCYHYQLHFLFTWTQSFWPLCVGPGSPVLHAFIHILIIDFCNKLEKHSRPKVCGLNKQLNGDYTELTQSSGYKLKHTDQPFRLIWATFMSQNHLQPQDFTSSLILFTYYSIQDRFQAISILIHAHTFFIQIHSLITHLVSNVRSTPSVLSFLHLLLSWLFKSPFW